MSADLTISPEKRKKLQELFVRGNEQMTKGGYEYADKIYFTECVLQDPANKMYAQTFLANLRKKFGEKKKTSRSFIAAGKTMVVDGKKPESLFKAGIETLKSNPWDIETLISVGKACEALGGLESAVVYLQAAVDADPDHVGANHACCAVLREVADYDGAIACVKRILKRQPDDRDAKTLLTNLSAERTIHKGKYAQGEAQAVETKEMTDSVDVMGRPLTVVEQIERRIAKNPQDTANYLELAQWYSNESDLVQAEECYARAVKVSKNAPEMVERLLETQKKRLHRESLRLKEEYEKSPQEDQKSVFFAARNEYDVKSMELAKHRVQHYPSHTGFRYDYGVLLQKSGQVKEAIAELQLAKAEPTRLGDCLLALGQCFQMIKQYKLAMTHYHDAVQALEAGENKKKALHLAMKLAFTLEDYDLAESYGHQLAAIDYSYRDLGDMLKQISNAKAEQS
jgi:tetratricopeptide (TPR) repeat protein